MNFDLKKNTILLAVGGSRAYGINVSTSDVDVKGVAIPPLEYHLGFLNKFEQADKATNLDCFAEYLNEEEELAVSQSKLEGVVYDLRKFISLAVDANPNILDVIFCRDSEVKVTTPLGEKLRENQEMFISAKAKHTFSGYAAAQAKRIKSHRRWLLKPPTHKPTRAEYDLPDHTLIPKDQMAAAWSMVQKKMDSWNFDFNTLSEPDRIHVLGQIERTLTEIGSTTETVWKSASRVVGLSDGFIQLLDRERRYSGAMTEYKQYENWKSERNVARAELEAKHGYDTKHGAHLYRLLSMGKEILTTGKVNIWRGDIDADIIRGIRNGEMDYDTLVSWAEKTDNELNQIYKEKKYIVPHEPPRQKIDDLCVELISQHLNLK